MTRTVLSFGDALGSDVRQSGQATIHLKTSMLVPELHSEDVDLTDNIATMEALIQEISRRIKVDLIDDTGDLIDFIDVRLNGVNINFFSAGLATKLKHDDHVRIRLIPIGGG